MLRRILLWSTIAALSCCAAHAQPPGGAKAEIRPVRIRTHLIDGQVVIATPDTLQDIWEVGGFIDLSLADGELTVTSSSSDDTIAGTGAQKVRLRGNTAEAFPKFLSVEIDMAGTGNVTTTGISFQGMSLAQARVIQSDDLERVDLPTGTITITQSGQTVGIILPGELQTHHAFRRIPYGPDGEIETWSLVGGQFSLRDLAGKADAAAVLELWTLSPGDQAHTDGKVAINASNESNVSTLFGESYVSGETFALRVICDQSAVSFFVDIQANVFVDQLVRVVHTIPFQ